jgi:hypothetical protein
VAWFAVAVCICSPQPGVTCTRRPAARAAISPASMAVSLHQAGSIPTSGIFSPQPYQPACQASAQAQLLGPACLSPVLPTYKKQEASHHEAWIEPSRVILAEVQPLDPGADSITSKSRSPH